MPNEILDSTKHRELQVDWTTSLFLILTPIVALIMTPLHFVFNGLSWSLIGLLVIYGGASNLSITAGYHRLFSHQSYKAATWLNLFYLFVGAGAFQGSALKWCTDHRRHHRFVDTEKDPYNINRGFFFAHMGWLFLKDNSEFKGQYAADLARDKWVMLQHKYYVPIAIIAGFGVPTWIGWILGSPFGGLIFGGFLRIVITQHTTFLINSYCHYFGKQTYGKSNSAKDSVIVSFFTHGEGYHNFHHHFQADYRNGIRWYDWDPTKWWIRFLSFMGATKSLRRIAPEKILAAQLEEQHRNLVAKGVSHEWIEKFRARVIESRERWQQLKIEYREVKLSMKMSMKVASRDRVDEFKAQYQKLKWEIKRAKLEFKLARKQWQLVLSQYQRDPLSC